MEERRRAAWIRGLWEMLKEGIGQKFLTWRIPFPPLLPPNQLSGLNIIITGATGGMGFHIARELAMAGANVIMACRNMERANQIAREWREEARDGTLTNVEIMQLNLLSLSSVHRFVENWQKHTKPLHVLINNAGAFYAKELQKFTEDGIDQHMQVNHIAPALLTLLLLPCLLKAPSSRIVNVNSVGHHCAIIDTSHWTNKIDEDKFHDITSYGESKLAQLMFLKTLAAKLLEKRINTIQCIAVNPGIVNTNMVKKVSVPDWKLFWMLTPAEGARSVLFCATAASVADHLIEGFALYSCACKPSKESPEAMNVESCLNVWQKTMEILHLDVNFLSQLMKC